MSEPVLPLGGASYSGLVTVSEHGPVGQVTFRGDLSSEAVKAAIKDVTGLDVPGLREVSVDGDTCVIWMSPDELLLICGYAEAGGLVDALSEKLAGEHVLAVNVSDARAAFRLKGKHVREVLGKLAPVDLDPAVFTPGMVRRTRLAQVAAGFWLLDQETAQVFCFRSVSEYMFNLLKTVSDPQSAVGYYSA